MSNLTRIKNNQITDSTIQASAKLAAGSITGNLLAGTVTFNSNITILGNLTIANSYTQLNSINTYINDPVVVFNNGFVGSPSYDIGILVNRNLTSLAPYGAVNAAFVWKEADSAFAGVLTTETGTTAGSINNSGWANLQIGNITGVSSTITGASTLATATVGGLQAKAIGNVTPGTFVFTTGTFNEDITASSNVSVSGNLAVTQNTILNQSLTVVGTTYTSEFYAGGIQAQAIGNITPGTGTFVAIIVNSSTPTSTGNITNFEYMRTGNLIANSAVASTSTTTGALLITNGGGAGISGNVYIGGSAVIGGNLTVTGTLTAIQSTTLDVSDLNITVAKGAVSAAAANGAGLTVDGASATILYTNATDTWNLNKGLVVTGATTLSTATAGGVQAQAIGNVTPGTGAFTTITASSTLDVTGATTLSTATTGGLQAQAIGNVTPGTAAFTTIAASGVTTLSGNLVAGSQTNSTSKTTGALVVVGGTGIMANVFVGGATTLGSNRAAGYDTVTQGLNDASLIWARSGAAYDQVLIGGSGTASTLIRGAKLQINSTDSILLPVGTNSDRPSSAGGTDTAGMFRYSTTAGGPEYYDGDSWNSLVTTFTVITDEQFNGTGSQVNFTLAAEVTTAATIVSINGVLQLPTLAYSVSGTTLTFTEAPGSADIIDVRRLTTTATVTSIASLNGYMSVLIDNQGVYITAGTAAATVVTYWNSDGAEVSSRANVLVTTASSPTTVDTFLTSTYSSAEYFCTATIQDTNIREVVKIHVVTNGTTATAMDYGAVTTSGNTLVTWGASVASGNVLLSATTTNANTILRIRKNLQAI